MTENGRSEGMLDELYNTVIPCQAPAITAGHGPTLQVDTVF